MKIYPKFIVSPLGILRPVYNQEQELRVRKFYFWVSIVFGVLTLAAIAAFATLIITLMSLVVNQ